MAGKQNQVSFSLQVGKVTKSHQQVKLTDRPSHFHPHHKSSKQILIETNISRLRSHLGGAHMLKILWKYYQYLKNIVKILSDSGLTSVVLTCSATNPTLGQTASARKRLLLQCKNILIARPLLWEISLSLNFPDAPDRVSVSGPSRVRAGEKVVLV